MSSNQLPLSPAFQMLLKGDAANALIRKAEDSVIRFIFSAQPDQQLERLDAVMLGAEKSLYRKDARHGMNRLIHAIAARMFDRRELDLFFHYFARNASQRNDEITAARMETSYYRGRVPDAQLQMVACVHFLTEVFRFAGGSLSRSMQFGLEILGRANEATQNVLTGVYRLEGDPPRGTAIELLYHCAMNPPSDDTPATLWIEQLIRAAGNNSEARMILVAVLNLLSARTRYKIIVGGVKTGKEKEMLQHMIDSGKLPPVTILLREELLPEVNRIVEEHRKKADADAQQSTSCMHRFLEHWPVAMQKMVRYREEIISKPRRGLRPNGADHVEITIDALYWAGFRSVVLIPDGLHYPDVDLRILLRGDTPHILTLPLQVRNLQVNLSDSPLYKLFREQTKSATLEQKFSELGKMLEYMIIDILHRIIVEGRDLTRKPKRHSGSEGDQKGKKSTVRCHTRELLPGEHASEAAKGRAEKAWPWKNLPAGVTFVKAHVRGTQIEYDLPIEPVAVYSEKNLFEGLIE